MGEIEITMTRCPICGAEQKINSRYPHYVCAPCTREAQDEEGRPLSLSNSSSAGGLIVTVTATGEERASPEVFIRDIRCIAKEARFGGVVVQVPNE